MPTPEKLVAASLEEHGMYRLIGNPAKPSGWLCRCGVEVGSAEERLEHRARAVVEALGLSGEK